MHCLVPFVCCGRFVLLFAFCAIVSVCQGSEGLFKIVGAAGGTLLARFRRGGVDIIEMCLLSARLFCFCQNKNLRGSARAFTEGEVSLRWF
ncbi:hypothetical protein CL630_01305 [bacterium]|nr:hypothetical protein [bacterium]|tara:strand:- start:8444 stop:8716 length:273 start_codon:yes stop_codon:yes gene_type:complete